MQQLAIDAGPQMLSVGTKNVFAAQPYKVGTQEFVGRNQEMRLITAAWLADRGSLPMSPLLIGEPGLGKNRLIYELAYRTGKDLYIFQGHEDVTAEDLACAVRFSDDANRKMDYVLSPLVTAMIRGGICFIDEIAKIRPRALALLVSVLDERRYIDSTLLGERVTAHPGFRFVAATNTADLEGNAMPEFLRSRMRPEIRIGYPPQEEINDIVAKRFPRLEEAIGELLDWFWELWDEKSKHLKSTTPPSPRDVIHVFSLAMSLADYARLGGNVESNDGVDPLIVGKSAVVVAKPMLAEAFHELFKTA
ncbi:MAG: MoxR family ATPase [Planctomycetaceae bacterium]|nr:MoxR family ATPase [Planctomycetaceae bacterium]